MTERGPTFVVAACIVRDDRILLARRNQPYLPEAHLKWELPGGKVRFEESPHEAVVREIREELGTTIRPVRLLPHVQSNVYYGMERTVHSIVIAFESVLSLGAPEPRANEEAIQAIRWVAKDELFPSDLLPGTQQFVECLRRLETASYGAAVINVRLERRGDKGEPRDFWQLSLIHDLWNRLNLIERHGNYTTRSTHNKVRPIPEEVDKIKELTKRVRFLARYGYYITESDDPRLNVGVGGVGRRL